MDDLDFSRRVRTMQILAFALMLGVLMFLGIVCYVVFDQHQGHGTGVPTETPMITFVALAMFAGTVPASFFVPNILMQQAKRRIASESTDKKDHTTTLLALRQTALIVGLALLEGPAFFACIAFLVEARRDALGLVAVAVLLMATRFPTESGIRNAIQQDVEQLNSLRR